MTSKLNSVKNLSIRPVDYRFPSGNEHLLRGLPKKQLTTEQENALASRIQQAKEKKRTDEESINELALYNMREAFSYACGCNRNGRLIAPGIIISICWAALSSAAGNFQPGRIRFMAYAKPYVRGEVIKSFNTDKVVRNADCRSLVPDEIFGTSEDDHDGVELHKTVDTKDLLFAKVDVIESNAEGIMTRDEWNVLVPILQSRLSEKERMVLELKYQSGFNFRQIGDLLRVSRSDTQATHTRAINKVRGALKGKRALFCR